MPFTGLSASGQFIAGPLNGESVAATVGMLAQAEVPILDWLGDAAGFATDIAHSFLEEELRPNFYVSSTAVNSASTGINVQDFGDLLTVGTVLEYVPSALSSAGAGVQIQVGSIVGANSIHFSQNFGGSGLMPNSIAPGAEFMVLGDYALEGGDHPGRDVSRPRRRRTNYVSLFHTPVHISGTQTRLRSGLGGVADEMSHQETNRLAEALRGLERMLINGRTSGNSIGSVTAYRSAQGLRGYITSINSTVTASSFQNDPHLYIGDAMENAFRNGAMETEEWGVIAGRSAFRHISNMNSAKVQDSNQSEQFKRVIRDYEGPFGRMQVFLTRNLPATALLCVPRGRVRVVPMQGSSFHIQRMGKTGDNEKSLIVGEYTTEVHHPQAMAAIRF